MTLAKIPYPWPILDAEARSDGAALTVIVGLPGAYKTWLARAVARHVRELGLGIALSSRDSVDMALAARSLCYPDPKNTVLVLTWPEVASGIAADAELRHREDPPVELLLADGALPEDLGWLSDLAATRQIAVLATMTTRRQMPGKHQLLPPRTIRVTGPLPRSGRLFLDCEMPECRLGFELDVVRAADGPEFRVAK